MHTAHFRPSHFFRYCPWHAFISGVLSLVLLNSNKCAISIAISLFWFYRQQLCKRKGKRKPNSRQQKTDLNKSNSVRYRWQENAATTQNECNCGRRDEQSWFVIHEYFAFRQVKTLSNVILWIFLPLIKRLLLKMWHFPWISTISNWIFLFLLEKCWSIFIAIIEFERINIHLLQQFSVPDVATMWMNRFLCSPIHTIVSTHS